MFAKEPVNLKMKIDEKITKNEEKIDTDKYDFIESEIESEMEFDEFK